MYSDLHSCVWFHVGRVLESHSSLSAAMTNGRLTQHITYRMLVSEVLFSEALCDAWCDCCASRADRHTQHTLRPVYITTLCSKPAEATQNHDSTNTGSTNDWQRHTNHDRLNAVKTDRHRNKNKKKSKSRLY